MTQPTKQAERDQAQRRPETGSGVNNTAKGRETVEAILAAAEEVLISVGYANFTARRVAESAGIALGNLTYHFPSMDDLTRALVNYVLGRYLRRWHAFRDANSGPTATASLGDIMGWLISDAVEPHTTKLFRELWAMGSQSKFAAEAMDDFYRQATRAAADVARLMFPHLSEAEAINLAYLMAAISEGSIVLFGTLPESSRQVRNLQQLATRALECLTTSEAAPDANPRTTSRRSGGTSATRGARRK